MSAARRRGELGLVPPLSQRSSDTFINATYAADGFAAYKCGETVGFLTGSDYARSFLRNQVFFWRGVIFFSLGLIK